MKLLEFGMRERGAEGYLDLFAWGKHRAIEVCASFSNVSRLGFTETCAVAHPDSNTRRLTDVSEQKVSANCEALIHAVRTGEIRFHRHEPSAIAGFRECFVRFRKAL